MNYIVHHFHAFGFSHLTSAPILVGNECVQVSIEEWKDLVLVFGQDLSERKKQADIDRQHIEPATKPATEHADCRYMNNGWRTNPTHTTTDMTSDCNSTIILF